MKKELFKENKVIINNQFFLSKTRREEKSTELGLRWAIFI
jgi:hypothetical protein